MECIIWLVNIMTIKDKLSQIQYDDFGNRYITFCDIQWKLNNDDYICIYNNRDDYNKKHCLAKILLRDSQDIYNYLPLDFDIFGIEKQNPIINQLDIYFILNADFVDKSSMSSKIKFI